MKTAVVDPRHTQNIYRFNNSAVLEILKELYPDEDLSDYKKNLTAEFVKTHAIGVADAKMFFKDDLVATVENKMLANGKLEIKFYKKGEGNEL